MAHTEGKQAGAARWRDRDAAQKAFFDACDRGDEGMLAATLALEGELAVDVHVINGFLGWTGFAQSSRRGHVGCMVQLLALTGPRRIDVNASGDWAFRNASTDGQLPAVDLLLSLDGDRTVDVNAESGLALQWACYNGHVPVAVRLLTLDDGRAVDVHLRDEGALRKAAGKQQGATVALLLAATGRHAPDPAVVLELGLEGARADAIWAGSPLRGGRGVLVACRAARRAAVGAGK